MPQIDDDIWAQVKTLLDDVCSDKLRYQIIGQARALKALLDPPVEIDPDWELTKELCLKHGFKFYPHRNEIPVTWTGPHAIYEAIRRARKLEAEECARIIEPYADSYAQMNRVDPGCCVSVRSVEEDIRRNMISAIRQRSADHVG